MSDFLRPHGLYSPWDSPGQNTGVGSLFLLQGIFPNQESNSGLPHYRWIFYQLSHKGSISHEDFPTSVSLSEESAMANSSENAHWIQIYWINKNVKVLGK